MSGPLLDLKNANRIWVGQSEAKELWVGGAHWVRPVIGPSYGRVISVDIGTGTTIVGSGLSAGVFPRTQWTQAASFPNFSNVVCPSDDGSVSLTITASGLSGNAATLATNDGSGNYRLLSRGVSVSPSATITATGIPFQTYDVIIYGDVRVTDAYAMTISMNGKSVDAVGAGRQYSGALVEGRTHVVLRGVVGSSGGMSFATNANNYVSSWAVCAMQFVEVL